MSNTVKNLKSRTQTAKRSTLEALSADLAEAEARATTPGNPRIAQDTAMVNRVSAQIVRLHISGFNSIVDSNAVKNAVDEIAAAASTLKREAARVSDIADDLNAWSDRIDVATGLIDRIRELI